MGLSFAGKPLAERRWCARELPERQNGKSRRADKKKPGQTNLTGPGASSRGKERNLAIK
jgi:hypothetical protein